MGGTAVRPSPPTRRGWTRRRGGTVALPRFDVLLPHASGSGVWRCGWAGMVWGTDDMHCVFIGRGWGFHSWNNKKFL